MSLHLRKWSNQNTKGCTSSCTNAEGSSYSLFFLLFTHIKSQCTALYKNDAAYCTMWTKITARGKADIKRETKKALTFHSTCTPCVFSANPQGVSRFSIVLCIYSIDSTHALRFSFCSFQKPKRFLQKSSLDSILTFCVERKSTLHAYAEKDILIAKYVVSNVGWLFFWESGKRDKCVGWRMCSPHWITNFSCCCHCF